MNDGAYFNASSAQTVRPRETTNGPIGQSKKAKMLDMSTRHRFGTEYAVSAVMAGSRGNESQEAHKALGSRDYKPAESAKKDTATVAPIHGAVGS